MCNHAPPKKKDIGLQNISVQLYMTHFSPEKTCTPLGIFLPYTFLGKLIALISIDSKCRVDLLVCSRVLSSPSNTVHVSGFEIGWPTGIILKAKSSRVLSLVSGKVRYTTV